MHQRLTQTLIEVTDVNTERLGYAVQNARCNPADSCLVVVDLLVA